MDGLSNEIEIIIGASIFLIVIAIGIVILILIYQKRQLQYIHEKSQLRISYENQILQAQLEIQEQTLKNISQEIHDNVGQVLTLAKLHLATSQIAEIVAAEKVKTSQTLIAKAIQDLRDLSRSLNTDYVAEMGLVRSIEYELELLQKTGTMETSFSLVGMKVKLDKQKELILFRIIQETIHNIIKHAQAKKMMVALNFTAESLHISISDNGKGFDTSPLNDPNNQQFGLGIRNMKSRASLIGAMFSLKSQPQQGTQIDLQIPFNETNDEGSSKN